MAAGARTGEFELIDRLKKMIPRSLQGGSPIGDDAGFLPKISGRGARQQRRSALYRSAGRAHLSAPYFLTTDMIVEGVDFRLGRGGATGPGAGAPRLQDVSKTGRFAASGPGAGAPRLQDVSKTGRFAASGRQIGHKALAVNLSDCAAMGGRPVGFVAALGIPKNFSSRFIEEIGRGMIQLAKKFRVAWVGGDLSRSRELVISIALVGEAADGKGILRSGARPGDQIFVTGTLGGSILKKHLTFTPRLREAEFLAEHFPPSALIDVSDGFIQDLGHLLTASKAGAKIELDSIPVSKAAFRIASLSPLTPTPFGFASGDCSAALSPLWGERERVPGNQVRGGLVLQALRHALTDGEDFELLGTISKQKWNRLEKAWRRRFPNVRLSRVGEITAGRSGIQWQMGKRSLKQLWFQKKGFTHF